MARVRYGIVAFIDALGVRGFDLDSCKRFLRIRDSLINILGDRWDGAAKQHSAESGNSSTVRLHHMTFGDTIALAVELNEFSSKHGTTPFPTDSESSNSLFYAMWLERTSYVIGDAIRDAVGEGIFFRGAISAGQFLIQKKGSSLLGPAVNDAASWYERLESAGVVLTPHAGYLMEYLSLHRRPSASVLKTTSALKSGPKTMYQVNWPNSFVRQKYDEETISEARDRLMMAIANAHIPLGTEGKFAETLEFFNFAISAGLPPSDDDVPEM